MPVAERQARVAAVLYFRWVHWALVFRGRRRSAVILQWMIWSGTHDAEAVVGRVSPTSQLRSRFKESLAFHGNDGRPRASKLSRHHSARLRSTAPVPDPDQFCPIGFLIPF